MPSPQLLETGPAFIDAKVRTVYVDWFFEAGKKMGFDAETPAIAINILERSVGSGIGRTKPDFLLAMYVCFDLAARAHEEVRINYPGQSCKVAKHNAQTMESKVLQCKYVKWRVHPVTTHCLSRNIMFVIPASSKVIADQREQDVETLLEIAAGEYEHLNDLPSTIAFAAVLASTRVCNLPVETLWNLARSIPALNHKRILICEEMMLQLLLFGEDDVIAKSPTGIDDIETIRTLQPISSMNLMLPTCPSTQAKRQHSTAFYQENMMTNANCNKRACTHTQLLRPVQ
jgi:hypothetical protein